MKTTLKDYYEMLEAHDWHYNMSDDNRAFKAGAISLRKMVSISGESDEHKALFEAFKAYSRSWEEPKAEKPVKPE